MKKTVIFIIITLCLVVGVILLSTKQTKEVSHVSEKINEISVVESNFKQSYIIRTDNHVFVLPIGAVLIKDTNSNEDLVTLTEDNKLDYICITNETFQYILKYVRIE